MGRGRRDSRKAEYHDANLPPRHAYIAFYIWLREIARDEPGCLAIREFQWEHRSLGPELRIERIRICLEFRF